MMQPLSVPPCIVIALVRCACCFAASDRGTEEMMQPDLVCRHVISLVPPAHARVGCVWCTSRFSHHRGRFCAQLESYVKGCLALERMTYNPGAFPEPFAAFHWPLTAFP